MIYLQLQIFIIHIMNTLIYVVYININIYLFTYIIVYYYNTYLTFCCSVSMCNLFLFLTIYINVFPIIYLESFLMCDNILCIFYLVVHINFNETIQNTMAGKILQKNIILFIIPHYSLHIGKE